MNNKYVKAFLGIVLLSMSLTACGLTGTANSKHHTVTFDTSGGTYIEPQKIKHGEKVLKPDDPEREGYSFITWLFNDEEWSFVGYVVTEDMTITASWSANSYTLTLDVPASDIVIGNTATGGGTYEYDSEVTLTANQAPGYSFVGWLDQDGEILSADNPYTFTMGLSQTIIPTWSKNSSYLTVISDDTRKGSVSNSSGMYEFQQKVTVTAYPTVGSMFVGWFNGNEKLSNERQFVFEMPDGNCTLTAHFITLNGNQNIDAEPFIDSFAKTITYGLYPQTNVNDSTLLASLNALPPDTDEYYCDDGYFVRLHATPNGSNCVFDNGTKIIFGQTYWFKCEPIIWNILDNNNGEYYLLASMVLDVHDYSTNESNNYKDSEIRSWLTHDFFDFAFAYHNNYIQTTDVDNEGPVTSQSVNRYSCENTNDKVFLPSYQEYDTSFGFGTSLSRQCKTTDWARARGVYYSGSSDYLYNGRYWTRSPCDGYPFEAWTIHTSGDFSYRRLRTNDTVGVRPAITFSMNE